MFGDMMKQMEEMQAKMQEQLAQQTFEAEAGGGAVKVTCDGTRTIHNVSIDPEQVDPSDLEALEDLVVVATNRALEQAAAYEAQQAGGMMDNMLPGGLGSILGG
ncbi:YbaB/EbfC family nucleoid-associated protein [Lewinella sp. JB7]|uniref:YbaB/EbfC family nucleoid-associated protein n=1 Tax=Lewinella sp. JB7 TaxID=2962887 RepID=UPI0020C9CE96|nr:YbaB/EbfC family nucleoid-associated protein [Lewinella sp. JB7]MCP9237494.1 YbaB/EbfC family nucleoid-associated protein [Lewinella sp. JB7]